MGLGNLQISAGDSAPSDEAARLRFIDELDLGSQDQRLDAITDFAAKLCDAPVALVSMIDERRQFFLGATGTDLTETPRSVSFCAHAMLQNAIMQVPDARQDPRFADNPLVTGEPHIRFYAGAPLISDDGHALGALCVIDDRPREGLTELQRQGLVVLAQGVIARLRDRRESIGAKRALDESEGRFRVLADAMPQMVWSTRPDGYHDYYNARWYEFTGMPAGSTDGEEWNGMFHPEDQARAWEVWGHSLKTGEPYEIEYRLRRHDGDYRWTLGRALPIRNDAGEVVRWFGTCTDIHDQHLLRDERELVSRELTHRIKNIFAVISGMIRLSARNSPRMEPIADALVGAIGSLSRANDFVMSEKAAEERAGSGIHSLLGQLVQFYQMGGSTRIVLAGDNPPIAAAAVTPVSLIVHELATNSAKYGALSAATGQVALTVKDDGGALVIDWVELGGPRVTAPQASDDGFGSKLMEISAERQLAGKIARDWRAEGLAVTITLPRGRVVA